MKGLIADVFKPADGADCTANGVTKRVKEVTIVGLGAFTEVFEANSERPEFVIKSKYFGPGIGKPYRYAVPKVLADKNAWVMFGGNFIYSSDSRFQKLVCEYPVPVHDRVEHQCGHTIVNWQEDGTCFACELQKETQPA